MPILAVDDVIVDGDAERDGNVDDGLGRLDIRLRIELRGFRFSSSRLRTRMTQSWSFCPDAHIPLQNKKKLAHPTRFERVTFASRLK
jgi:hypothetical protein